MKEIKMKIKIKKESKKIKKYTILIIFKFCCIFHLCKISLEYRIGKLPLPNKYITRIQAYRSYKSKCYEWKT